MKCNSKRDIPHPTLVPERRNISFPSFHFRLSTNQSKDSLVLELRRTQLFTMKKKRRAYKTYPLRKNKNHDPYI